MFKCNDCGCEFESPVEGREYHGLEYGFETTYHCPNCGSNDYNAGKVCTICGEKHFGDDPYCEWCLADAIGEIRTLFAGYKVKDVFKLIDLYTGAVDSIYVEERSKRR